MKVRIINHCRNDNTNMPKSKRKTVLEFEYKVHINQNFEFMCIVYACILASSYIKSCKPKLLTLQIGIINRIYVHI